MTGGAERSELAEILPQVREQPRLQEDAAGFSYETGPDETYVVPSLSQASGSAANPSLVLVEARAAVGKSMLARHLAWASGAPLWDLTDTYVGTGTLWGSLARAFGPTELNNVIGRAATGGLVLVIDALDEAEMHAGGEAFDAFLVELRDMFAAPRPMPGAVILGRTETIDYVEIFLKSSVPVSRYRILDFDRDLAYRFVDRRLNIGSISNPSFTADEQYKREMLYENARGRFFDFLIDRLIPDSQRSNAGQGGESIAWPPRISSFLGYAPVLEAIVEYLASYASNFAALISELRNMETDLFHSGNAPWRMLHAIVLRLLWREQEKVVAQFKKVIPESTAINWAKLYDPEEQCSRILGRTSHNLELQEAIADIPPGLIPRYRDLLSNAIPNHPFLGKVHGYANVVFRDYIHAWGLCSDNSTVKLAVRSELRFNDYLPSPLLGPFILAGSAGGFLPIIDGEDVGFVYESLLTHGEADLYLFAEPNEPANVFIGTEPEADVAVFQVRNPDNGIQFWRRLLRAQIRGELVVELGLVGRSFSLGPNVSVECVILNVPCRAVRVYTKRSQGVHLSASAGYVGGSIDLEVSKFGPGPLTVAWDEVRYPWVQFALSPREQLEVREQREARELLNDPTLRHSFLLLCQIAQKFATGFRTKKALWGPVRYNSLSLAPRSDMSLNYIISGLKAEHIILERRSYYYFLDARRLEDYEVRFFDLCARKETAGALRLLKRVMEAGQASYE
jgi:hypothetical protein